MKRLSPQLSGYQLGEALIEEDRSFSLDNIIKFIDLSTPGGPCQAFAQYVSE